MWLLGVKWLIKLVMEETQNTRLTTCIFVVLCSQEESDDAKKLKEARLAAYAAKKAKSKFPVIGIYSFFSYVTEWHITKTKFAKDSQGVVYCLKTLPTLSIWEGH